MQAKSGESTELRFFPFGASDAGLKATSPEEVAQLGITVYPEALEQTFGAGAANRYRKAMGLKVETANGATE